MSYLKNKNLSWKAKGLLTFLLKLDGEGFYKKDLVSFSKDGYESMISGLNELKEAGHITVEKVREEGRFSGYEYEVIEFPNLDKNENRTD